MSHNTKLRKEIEVLTEQLTKTQADFSILTNEHSALSVIHIQREIQIARLESKIKGMRT